ncbi:hypothetical protein BD289DRAFT_422427 [Coniella lustricola]|uniref:Uncharacterized protein n=1 Tax=Coniella lustricola TaxID=2025994 RepID=A0A2T3AKV3_9PEZI|nr:hypothetical protein BD289DRAFT_422427 [Coniella lustricola]
MHRGEAWHGVRTSDFNIHCCHRYSACFLVHHRLSSCLPNLDIPKSSPIFGSASHCHGILAAPPIASLLVDDEAAFSLLVSLFQRVPPSPGPASSHSFFSFLPPRFIAILHSSPPPTPLFRQYSSPEAHQSSLDTLSIVIYTPKACITHPQHFLRYLQDDAH